MDVSNRPAESASKKTARDLKDFIETLYGKPARVFRAPGRVNLIGEHTDYNDGFVMPAAIGFYIWVAISPRDDRKLTIQSKNFPDYLEIDLDEGNSERRDQWTDYVQGVAVMLQRTGHRLRGANVLVKGDIPIGAGLSSSAAVGVATALALVENSEVHVPREKLAQVCQRSENEFVGAHVGIMDPFVSCCGRQGKALMLDCRSLDFQQLAVPEDISLVICNTMVKHAHSGGGYNRRREECDEGVRLMQGALPTIRALRDVGLEELNDHLASLPDVIYRRCRHVISENARVLAAAEALRHGELSRFGNLMAESHKSLRDDFEVSCRELDVMVEIAAAQKGVYGSRMTGGGFGGCTINAVSNAEVKDFQSNVAPAYEEETGLKPEIFVSKAAEGASEVMV